MKQTVVITIDGSGPDQMDQITFQLQQQGAEVTKTYPFGVVIADADPAVIHNLKKIKGVQHVEIEGEIQLPPPDADIQ